MKNKYRFNPLLLFLALWIGWAIWSHYGPASVLVNLIAIALVWGFVPLATMLVGNKSGEGWIVPPDKLLLAPFPVLPCVVSLCLTTAFLYTVRVCSGLVHTFPILDWCFLALSVCAGVVEEFFFRAYLFGRTLPSLGFWPAACLNGLLFTVYHYPGLLFGNDFALLLSPRALLVFTMGVIFCFMFRKWQCIAMNMVVHTVWNILSYLLCVG